MIAAGLRGLVRVAGAAGSRWRNLYYRALGVRISGYAWLRRIEIPRNWGSITLEGPWLDQGVVLLASGPETPGKITIRAGTYVNRYTMFDAHHRVEVGATA